MSKRMEVDNEHLRSPELKKPRKIGFEPEIIKNYQYGKRILFENPQLSDVKIWINNKLFQGHKTILSRNPNFKKLFSLNPDLQEIHFSDERTYVTKINNKHDLETRTKIVILYLPSEACETFLRYLYDPTNIEADKLNLDLLVVANEFADENLKELCEDRLVKDLNIKNAVPNLMLSLQTNCKKLKKVASIFVAKNFSQMKSIASFQLVLEDESALAAIYDVLDECETTLLTKLNCVGNKIAYLSSSDLVLKIDNHQFLAHKDILSEQSTVFKKLIKAASTNGAAPTINIPDVDVETFETFLRFTYTNIESDWDVSTALLELSHRYDHEKLKQSCEKKFRRFLNQDNVIDLLIMAIEFKCEQLEKDASNFIVVRYREISTLTDFQRLLQVPQAASAIMKTFHERQLHDLALNISKKRFRVALPPDGHVFASPVFKVNDTKWCICIKKTSDLIYNIYLKNEDAASVPKVRVNCTMKLISRMNRKSDVVKSVNFTSDQRMDLSGLAISSSKLEDPKYGFISYGMILILVDVTLFRRF